MLRLYKPSDKLLPYVLKYYTINWTSSNKISELCLPSGNCFIVLQLKGNSYIKLEDKKLALPKVYIVGQQTVKYYIESDDTNVTILGIILKPTALFQLFNSINIEKLTNNVLPLESLFDNNSVYLNKEILFSNSTKNQIDLIEKFLFNIIEPRKINHTIIDYAIELINQKKGCTAIKDLVKKLNISQRYFQKKFKEVVGIQPSVFCRITRFNFLFSEMNTKSNDFSTLSILYNYYDLPHFAKDFKRYCGAAPSKFYLEKFKFLKQAFIKHPFIL